MAILRKYGAGLKLTDNGRTLEVDVDTAGAVPASLLTTDGDIIMRLAGVLARFATTAAGRALLAAADAAAQRVALGLGNSATRAVGTTAGTVAAGDDSRLSDARAPTAHKSTHATGGGDALSCADIGAVPVARTVTTLAGLTGGGALSSNLDIGVDDTVIATVAAMNTGDSDTLAAAEAYTDAAVAGGGGGSHTSGTLAALPASPAAGDTYAVTSGAQTGARFTCFVSGTWEGTMPRTSGHSWERPAAATAGQDATFLDIDTGVEYTSSGDNTIGWYVRVGGDNMPDRAGLIMGGSVYAPGIDLSGYTIGNCTLAALFTLTGAANATWSCAALLGEATGTRGIQFGFMLKPGDATKTNLVAHTNTSYPGAVLAEFSTASLSTGVHALAVAPVNNSGHKWRWSMDGSAVAEVAMGVLYVPPSTSDEVGAWSRSNGSYRITGRGHDMAAWKVTLSNADLVALTTLPGTPTYRLPITSGMGAPAIRVEANRVSPITPLALRAKGVPVALTVNSATPIDLT